jgi:replicative DNA helicase
MQQTLKDQLPPNNGEAEQAALGAMLLEDEAASIGVAKLKVDDFYSNANGRVFQAMRAIFDSGDKKKIDIISVCEELRREGTLEASGGEAYVVSLTNTVGTTANIEYYIGVVQDCALRRAIITVSRQMVDKARDISETSYQILERAQQFLFDLIENKHLSTSLDIKDLVRDTLKTIEENLNKEYTGVPCGFPAIDYYTGGFQKSEMIVIGARPSIGKTALALNMAADIAIRQHLPTGVFSLEMASTLVITRILAAEADVDTKAMRRLNTEGRSSNFQKLLTAASKVYEAPLYIEATPNMALLDLRTQARRIREMYHVEIIFIDYLGLIESDNRLAPRYEQVSEISRSIKSLARELKIPIVVLSQVARDSEGKPPSLSNLRDSGAVEQDADVVILMHRERKQADPSLPYIETDIEIAKNRNGPTGKVALAYYPQWTKFLTLDNRNTDVANKNVGDSKYK